MHTDNISDMFATIRNGQSAKLAKVSTPASKMKENVLTVLKKEGFIRDFHKTEEEKGKPRIEIEVKYFEGKGAISEIWKVSKPGRRVYSAINDVSKVRNGLGISIISTSKGIMSDNEARQKNIGGEVICSVF